MAASLAWAGPAPEAAGKMIFRDLDDMAHCPLEAGDKVGSVLIFFWQDCPVSNGYVPELNRIAASHTNFAFYIVQVDPELTRDAAREHARRFDLRPCVVLDPKHELVAFAQATVTPEAVVIGRRGEVVYRGRIDDNYAAFGKKRAVVTEHDLSEALDGLAAGKALKKTETKAIGCKIQ